MTLVPLTNLYLLMLRLLADIEQSERPYFTAAQVHFIARRFDELRDELLAEHSSESTSNQPNQEKHHV